MSFVVLGNQNTDPDGRDLGCVYLSDPDQIVNKVPGSVGLSVLLVGGVPHPDVVEAVDSDLQEERLGSELKCGAAEQRWRTHFTHELLPVLVSCSSDVVAGS